MKVSKTGFEGLYILEPKVHADSRGYFFESFNKRAFQESGLEFEYVQENQSYSKRNVIRGLHYQKAPSAQTKLIRVLQGSILDVVVDLRRQQPTYRQVYSIELSAEAKRHLLVPKGFAHGFSVQSDFAEVNYLCDTPYDPGLEAGILHSDPALGIDWRIEQSQSIVSSKDLSLPLLSEASFEF